MGPWPVIAEAWKIFKALFYKFRLLRLFSLRVN